MPNRTHIGSKRTENYRYGEAPAAAASWRAHDGRRQPGTACPHLYRYRLTHTHTARSLACPLLTLLSARPFFNCILRSNGAPASLPPASSSLTRARRMDGFCNQNADQLGSLAGPSLLTVYERTIIIGVVECTPASLPPESSSITHARRLDGFCNQNADQLGSLAGPSLLTVYCYDMRHTPSP
jgi:hypothetical protein